MIGNCHVVLPYPRINRRRFIEYLKPRLTPAGLENIETAYIFAKHGHRNQKREDGTRYFEHPRAVAWILAKELMITDWRIIVEALLHDLKEDTFLLSWRRIQINFGAIVVLDLKLLTKEPKHVYHHRLIELAGIRALMVKLADRTNNMRSLGACKLAKQMKQVKETREVYIPLTDLLIKKLPAKDKWRGEYLKNELVRLCEKYKAMFPKTNA